MKTLNRLFLAILTVGMVTGCSFGSGGTSRDDKAEYEDRERFMQEYSLVFGKYEGVLETRTPQKVQISIYPVDVPDGVNSRGEARTKVVAKAMFRWLDSNKADVFMDADFNAEIRELRLTREAAPTLPGSKAPPVSETFNVRGIVGSNSYDGIVTRNGGKLGDIKLTLISREASAPSEGDELERKERLRRLYTPYAGYYVGKVLFPGGEKRDIDLTVYVIEKINPDTGGLFIALESEYHWGEDKHRDLTLIMAMELRPEFDPPTITMASYPYKVPGTAYRISMSGTMVPGEARVTYTDHFQAKTGNVTLKRIRMKR